MAPRRQRAAWAAVTAAAVIVPFAPAVVGLRTLSQRDTDLLYAPVRTLVVAELGASRLPLWNPYEGTGMPLLAQGIHGVLHPISLLGAALAPSSIDFLILAYLVLAALGAFLLATALGASAPACAAAGIAFALSGFSASMTGNLVFLAGLSTLPWLLAAARAAGAGARFGPVGAALATACAFLSGDAQSAIVGIALGLLLAADAGGRRGAARALAGIATGILLAGVQILPTRALVPLTLRGAALPDDEKVRWALAPGRILELVVPGLFRGPLDEVPVDASGAWLPPVFAESVYLGAPVVLAAALGAISRDASGRRRTGLLLATAAGVLLWLALGHHLGARQLLDGVPVWGRFRYAEKLVAPLTLVACALAALGVDAFAAAPAPRAWTRAVAGLGIVAGATLAAARLSPAGTQAAATLLFGGAGPFYRYTFAAGVPHLVVALVAILAVGRIAAAGPRLLALALLVALAPAAAVLHGAHLGSVELRRSASPVRLETDSPAPRIHVEEPPLPGEDPQGAVDSATRIASLFLAPSTNVARRVDTVRPYTGLEPARVTALVVASGDAWPGALRRFGLTHVLAPPFRAPPGLVQDGRLAQRDDARGIEVWTVPHRPWAFLAGRAAAAPSPEDALREVLALSSRGDDSTVVIESARAPPTAPGRVLRVARGAAGVQVEAEAAGPGLLVVQDAFWPGWRATVDGRPAEILAADFLVRAVRWPPGRHVLEMTYEPPELREGLALSATGGVLVLFLAALAARGRREGDAR